MPRLFSAALALAAIAAAPAARAQDAAVPHPQSVYVVPSNAGEAVRVTTYAARPAESGRLSRRYRGITVHRDGPVTRGGRVAGLALPTTQIGTQRFVRLNDSAFPVVPAQR